MPFGVMGWRAAGIVAALVLIAVAFSDAAYHLTTPPGMPHHELVRKIDAVAAFALLGFLLEKAHVPGLRGPIAAGIALGFYSWAIELGQIAFDASQETLRQHAFDIASGLVGGALGATIVVPRRREATVVGALFVVLAFAYAVSYGRWSHGA